MISKFSEGELETGNLINPMEDQNFQALPRRTWDGNQTMHRLRAKKSSGSRSEKTPRCVCCPEDRWSNKCQSHSTCTLPSEKWTRCADWLSRLRDVFGVVMESHDPWTARLYSRHARTKLHAQSTGCQEAKEFVLRIGFAIYLLKH